MGGRGASSGGGGGGSADIRNTVDMLTLRQNSAYTQYVDASLEVFRDFRDKYGVVVEEIQVADMPNEPNVLAYRDYDGNIAVNKAWFNDSIESAYDECVDVKFHPSRGNKTGLQATIAHELGHALHNDISKKMGYGDNSVYGNMVASRAIIDRASLNLGRKIKPNTISGYAMTNDKETIAEAVCDFYCNGNKAKRESIEIVNVINSYY